MSEILQVLDLNKDYNGKPIIKDFSITLRNAHISTLLGHNGAGKTTAIRTMLGLEEKINGEILFKGKNIKHDYKYYKSKLGFIPDDDELFDDLTAMEYLNFLGKTRKIPKKDYVNITNHLLDVLDLYSYRNNLLKTYSHGMRRKVQIISGIIHNPEILIIDEPTNGLDPDMIITFKELIKTLRDLGTAILLSTHNLEFAENISDSITIIKNGEIKISGLKQHMLKELQVNNLEEAYIKVNLDSQKLQSIRNVFNYA
ncbi:ABC transporter ATP-binding protein [Bacillus suaedae]|uniref:ABC transporter ATP-binding protein n=1 Tax=Halalkalibacter suaedae TaxID=2822140 RepID=A0A941APM2_9BACI|nr:ABC transporter ATP-binding protein [Bacillus suaedae]MBP3950263.1 ABC transporter ATP-binding protein [Bacillus suaedae]